MVAVPQNIEDLFSAIQRGERARLMAWLDMFSSPEERYAALRALAESLEGQRTGPARDLARWANGLLYQSLGPVDDGAHRGPAPDRHEWGERARRVAGGDERFNYC
jgi:hypothetical protein